MSKGKSKNTIREYANQLNNQDYLNVVGKLNDRLLGQLENQIISQRMAINREKKSLTIQKSPQNNSSRKLQQIQSKKEQVQRELNNIQSEQILIKKNSMPNLSPVGRNFRSELTEQQKKKIKQISKASRKFQRELQLKTKAIQQKQRKDLQEIKQLQQKKKTQKCAERREQIQRRFQQIAKRAAQRKQKLDEDRKRIADLKNKKYVFQELEGKWKQIVEEQQKEKQKMKQQAKRQKMLNFQSIKEHEKKHDEFMKKHRQERQKRSSQFNEAHQSKTGRYSPSRFHLVIAEQQQKRKEQQQIRKNMPKNFSNKKLAYADKIRKTYKFKTIDKPEENQQEKVLPSLRALNTLDIHKKGNQYMRQVHSSIGTVTIEKSKVTQVQQHQLPFKYKDYLKDAKMARTVKQGSLQKQHRDIDQIKKIMRKQNVTQEQKFFKAKLVAQKIQGKQGNRAKNLVQSINAKIEILKQLSA